MSSLTGAEIGALLQESFIGPAWHGPSVVATLRGIDAATASWKPSPSMNSVWDIVLHLANARHRMLRRLGASSKFPRSLRAPWWPALPATRSDTEWVADIELLHSTHERLLDAVAKASASLLNKPCGSGRRLIKDQLIGLALHDTYHAGQIILLDRLHASSP